MIKLFSTLILILVASNSLVLCIIGKYETPDGLSDCPTNCFDCSSEDFCTHCLQGYFRSKDGKCLQCPFNCEGCLSETECLRCSNNYYLRLDLCHSCLNQHFDNLKPECIGECQENQYRSVHSFNSYLTECIECPDNCYSCSNANVCTHCKLGYFYSSGQCLACSENCLGCLNETTCMKCKDGYALVMGRCFE